MSVSINYCFGAALFLVDYLHLFLKIQDQILSHHIIFKRILEGISIVVPSTFWYSSNTFTFDTSLSRRYLLAEQLKSVSKRKSLDGLSLDCQYSRSHPALPQYQTLLRHYLVPSAKSKKSYSDFAESNSAPSSNRSPLTGSSA